VVSTLYNPDYKNINAKRNLAKASVINIRKNAGVEMLAAA